VAGADVVDAVANWVSPCMRGFSSTIVSAAARPSAIHGEIQRNQPGILDMRAPASISTPVRCV
jgi:hypothetical protein